ncbi:C4-dicarboxylate ABC transporter substrate-binding protein [Pseudolabrys taiwanensis]|uniref:C4-dicarboxylate ABC transporter substrate-binding protein n=1 Tax=Pseudolabrys taiwanensis TaxID=331696 RepID=A0A346A1T9_9HYPH|nr:TRAP transporter substrate-binding protein [Pseudolabrys taiwanensis]AXK83136.1 C4-dicarboxylate ABC transporter substrate-binding protein [Pseudolabrys taiwanensis]
MIIETWCRLRAGMTAFALLATMVAGSTSELRADEVRLKLHTYVPLSVPPMQHLLKPWADHLSQASGGKLKIDIYPLMQLGGRQPQLVDQVKDGVVDMVWTLLGATPGRFPRTEVFELPFTHRSTLATNLALRDMLPKELADDFKDYKILLLHVHAGNAIHMKDAAVERFDQFKLKKIRSPGQISTEMLEAIGATPIATTLTDVSSMMSRGVIDGALLPFDVLPSIKLNSLVRYHVLMAGDQRPTTAVFMLAMNKKSYESLSPDLQKLIDDSTGIEMSKKAAEVMDRFDQLGMKASKDGGATFITLSAEETAKVRQASESVVAAWAKKLDAAGGNAQQVLSRAQELGAKYSPKAGQ